MKRKRKTPLPKLKKKLWKLFSELVRRKSANEYGMVRCVTCGSEKDWREVHAGHYIPASVCGLNLYFNPLNVHPQCVGCNLYRRGNLSQYALFLRNEYHDGILETLEDIRKTEAKWTRDDFESAIASMKVQLKNLDGVILGKH